MEAVAFALQDREGMLGCVTEPADVQRSRYEVAQVRALKETLKEKRVGDDVPLSEIDLIAQAGDPDNPNSITGALWRTLLWAIQDREAMIDGAGTITDRKVAQRELNAIWRLRKRLFGDRRTDIEAFFDNADTISFSELKGRNHISSAIRRDEQSTGHEDNG
ncbi:hypothetical protein [Marinobacter sp.]|uniref:hypothetical protein n=1 Tax=Marinobacter sp. TaxID=50741 RepID=UPI002628CAAE|nr:hypothetical protein [Marinobacter sp.]